MTADDIVRAVQPYTMTSAARILASIRAVDAILDRGVPGAIVECGVWRGGSMMAMALALLRRGVRERDLYLYDTFAGMTPPAARDVRLCDGAPAAHLLDILPPDSNVHAFAPFEDVVRNLESTGYPRERMHFVAGPVEQTIPHTVPDAIAVLRLDTDWYESTRHELVHLYPLLRPGGIVIIDDYGHWRGSREATDEYFAGAELPPRLDDVDGDAVLGVKPHPAPPHETETSTTVDLDTLDPVQASVGWGALGRRGDLGYDQKRVTVRHRRYDRALSTHAPARAAFDIGGRWSTFRCRVAFNDDVVPGRASADFSVLADGRRVAHVRNVVSGDAPREIIADVAGASTLELVVDTPWFGYAHTVWLEPRLDMVPCTAPRTMVDCLERAEMELVPRSAVDRCIATVVSPGFEYLLDDMLGSLRANGNCPEAALVVFLVGESAECDRVVAKYGATAVRCRPLRNVHVSIKSILYSAAHVVEARQYLCLDADILITGDLSPLFQALDVVPPRSILVCRAGNHQIARDLGAFYTSDYAGTAEERPRLMSEAEAQYRLVVNDGVFAGSREALLALDDCIRSMPYAVAWHDAPSAPPWRNQFLFNVALARLDAGVELDDAWNVQLYKSAISFDESTYRVVPSWAGRQPRIVHFTSWPKVRFPNVQGRYARVERPLVAPAPGDGYASFLYALRAWLGLYGAEALRDSLYGTGNGQPVDVGDASTFPLFAALHYVIRSNSCARVLETGTARGVSAACLASAVAHRENARVVTLDVEVQRERDDLWSSLPARMRECIEPRTTDPVEGLRDALANGERYDAALLDSPGDEALDLARQLVRPGGLILVRHAHELEQAGYGVAPLWTAEAHERLGLAIVENRRHP